MAKPDLHTVEGRNKLKARRDPYWTRIRAGQYLGFRKMSAKAEGNWSLRTRNEATGKQEHEPLGTFEHLPRSERYDAALKAAQDRLAHLGMGGSREVLTVREACARYVEHVRSNEESPRPKTADEMQARFARWVDIRAIGKVELSKLKKEHFRDWRRGLAKAPLKVGKGKEPSSEKRTAESLNRDMTPLRSAMNFAHEEGWIASDVAWKSTLKPIPRTGKPRRLYLDIGQRRLIVEKASADISLFLRGLSLLPLRPGALAALTVGDFDKRVGDLTIGKDKHGEDRKILLPSATQKFFIEQTKNKLPGAMLFTRADGVGWNKDSWKKPIKAAVEAAKLPKEVTAYTLRHSIITDLVKVQKLDLLTVAQLSGTSVQMIQEHYGHLLREHATQALAGLAL